MIKSEAGRRVQDNYKRDSGEFCKLSDNECVESVTGFHTIPYKLS